LRTPGWEHLVWKFALPVGGGGADGELIVRVNWVVLVRDPATELTFTV
jgi:hypothetical protein